MQFSVHTGKHPLFCLVSGHCRDRLVGHQIVELSFKLPFDLPKLAALTPF